MALKFTSAFKTLIADSGGIDDSVTSITMTAGDGARLALILPTIGTDHTYAVLDDGTNRETVKATGLSTDTLTVVRGVEDTAAAFAEGDYIIFALTKVALEEIFDKDLRESPLTIKNDSPTTIALTSQNDDVAGDTSVSVNDETGTERFTFGYDNDTDKLILNCPTGISISPSSIAVQGNVTVTNDMMIPIMDDAAVSDDNDLWNAPAPAIGYSPLTYVELTAEKIGDLFFIAAQSRINFYTASPIEGGDGPYWERLSIFTSPSTGYPAEISFMHNKTSWKDQMIVRRSDANATGFRHTATTIAKITKIGVLRIYYGLWGNTMEVANAGYAQIKAIRLKKA